MANHLHYGCHPLPTDKGAPPAPGIPLPIYRGIGPPIPACIPPPIPPGKPTGIPPRKPLERCASKLAARRQKKTC
jgi:hypothetical protein